MSLRVITPPTDYPLEVDTVKAHLNIGQDEIDWDDYIGGILIPAATEWAQNFCQRRYMAQTLEWVLQDFDCVLMLPVAPVASVTSIVYTGTDGQQHTLDPSTYIVTPVGAATAIRPAIDAVWPIIYPSAEPVVIRFVAGDDSPSASAKHAMLMVIAHWFQNREAITDGRVNQPFTVPLGAEALMLGEVW